MISDDALFDCFETGHVANFVETEQIVEHGDFLASFVQTRGKKEVSRKHGRGIRFGFCIINTELSEFPSTIPRTWDFARQSCQCL